MSKKTPATMYGEEHGKVAREMYDDTCNYVSSFFSTMFSDTKPAPTKRKVKRKVKAKR